MWGIFMNTKTIYLKLNQNILVKEEDVFLKDIATVFCEEKTYENKANAMKVIHFQRKEKKRVVISVVKIVEELTKLLPGVEINNLGQTDTIIEYLPEKKQNLTYNHILSREKH